MYRIVSEKDVLNTKRPAAISGCKNRGRRHCVRSPPMAMLSVTCYKWLLPIRSGQNTASLYVQNNTSDLDRCNKLNTFVHQNRRLLTNWNFYRSDDKKCDS